MGGNGVWYLAYRYPYRFAALVPICGFVTAFFPTARPFTPVVPADSGPPFEALARHLRRVPTWIVHGEIDGAVPVEQSRQAAAALKAGGAAGEDLEGLGADSHVVGGGYRAPGLLGLVFAQRRSR